MGTWMCESEVVTLGSFCCFWSAQLTSKPHAKTPLQPFTGAGPWPHPYAVEMNTLDYDAWMLAPNAETPFAALDATPFQFVETTKQFDALLLHLRSPDVREVAIDLEAHNTRSYHGFCCLMQVRQQRSQCLESRHARIRWRCARLLALPPPSRLRGAVVSRVVVPGSCPRGCMTSSSTRSRCGPGCRS